MFEFEVRPGVSLGGAFPKSQHYRSIARSVYSTYHDGCLNGTGW